MLSEVKERLEGPKYNIDFGRKGLGRQGKGIGMPTMQKGAILQKCLNTFVPHCLNAKLCYCTRVGNYMTMILTEIKGINDIIMLLVVGVTFVTYSRPNYRANSNYMMT